MTNHLIPNQERQKKMAFLHSKLLKHDIEEKRSTSDTFFPTHSLLLGKIHVRTVSH